MVTTLKPPAETEEIAVPRSGAVTLRDLAAQDGKLHITIHCQPCGRKGRYSVSRLLETMGDMGLPDVLAQLTQDCEKDKNVAIHNRCNAVFKW